MLVRSNPLILLIISACTLAGREVEIPFGYTVVSFKPSGSRKIWCLVLSENLTGLSRYIRSSVIPMLENIAHWHERDISHSSVERILAPDVTIGLNFALTRLTNLI